MLQYSQLNDKLLVIRNTNETIYTPIELTILAHDKTRDKNENFMIVHL